jgi:hypothetical protein
MIIGFVGFKHVGKSTAAKYLQEKYGGVRINMKDALVAEIKQNFPDTLRELGDKYTLSIDELFEQKPPIMRALLQNYGTEVRRRDADDYWVNKWKESVSQSHGQLITVDDVRFLNEAEAVTSQGGVLIRLVREDIDTGGTHASETEQVAIDTEYVIHCKGGDEDTLYRSLDAVISTLPAE